MYLVLSMLLAGSHLYVDSPNKSRFVIVASPARDGKRSGTKLKAPAKLAIVPGRMPPTRKRIFKHLGFEVRVE
jgi:hypothetical protein